MRFYHRAVSVAVLSSSVVLGAVACGSAPNDFPGAVSTASAEALTPSPSASASDKGLSAQEKFAKDVMVPKDLDLSGLVFPDEIKSRFPDSGKGAAVLMEQYVMAANSIAELNKGSHVNTAADYPLFEKLQPLMDPGAFEALKSDYVQPGGTAMVHNYANDGSGFHTLALGKVHPDDNGPVWQWNNEKATASYISGNGNEGISIDIPVRFSFKTSDKGVVSLYAKRTYQLVSKGDGSWLVAYIQWSAADTRSSLDSTMLLEAESPIDAG